MILNRGSYTNSFSTIVRVTRDPELDRLIEEGEDRIGADPLPNHIAEATVRFGERVGENAAKDDIAQRNGLNGFEAYNRCKLSWDPRK